MAVVPSKIIMKFGGKEYRLKLTLADAVVLKRDYGQGDLGNLQMMDPEVLSFMLTRAIEREDPTLSAEQVAERVGGIDFFESEAVGESEADPSRPATDAVAGAGVTGTSETTQGSAGRPPLDASTD